MWRLIAGLSVGLVAAEIVSHFTPARDTVVSLGGFGLTGVFLAAVAAGGFIMTRK